MSVMVTPTVSPHACSPCHGPQATHAPHPLVPRHIKSMWLRTNPSSCPAAPWPQTEDGGQLDVANARPVTIEVELPGMHSHCLEWTRTAISGMCMSHYIHIHCMVSLTCEAIQGWRLRYGFARLGVSMTRPHSMPNVMVRNTASRRNRLCGRDLWTHVCQVSSGIVDEVGASLPGRSVGPL